LNQFQDITSERWQMLDLVGVHRSAQVGSFRVDEWSGIAVHGNAFADFTNVQLDVQGIRLIRDNANALEEFFLEARLLDGEGVLSGWKSVEVENSVFVGGCDEFLVGIQIRKRERCSRNRSALRIGDHTLNGSAVLGPGCTRV